MAWPDTDEDRVHALAIAWRDASLAFTPVTVSRTIFATTAGEMFAQRVGGIDEWTLQAGANAADWKDGHSADPGDQAAVQLGIDLAHEYGPGALTPEKVTQAILDRYDRFQQAGVIRPM
ncbi:hypothetical protein GCM10027598_54930 [Amycolatopsis oliviviridis]|uniref:Uncharacterized protein n=2 Tax=Amycolatopsis oliviviridis TaxID=1471590 RepID=A0ABQ3MA93_9PSEU|nr:hypothetical protein GCM10017790_75940 [Amycolatopsis oliviviridis]